MNRPKYIHISGSNGDPLAIRYIRTKREWSAVISVINLMTRHFGKIYYVFDDDTTKPTLLGVNISLENKGSPMREDHIVKNFLYNVDKRYDIDVDYDTEKNFVYINIPMRNMKDYSDLTVEFSTLASMFFQITSKDDEMYRILNNRAGYVDAYLYVNPAQLMKIKMVLVKFFVDYFRGRNADEMEALKSIETYIGVWK